jgi:hypothetical protein
MSSLAETPCLNADDDLAGEAEARRYSIEVFTRHQDGWLLRPTPKDGGLVIAALPFCCALESVYEDVIFEQQAAPAAHVGKVAET